MIDSNLVIALGRRQEKAHGRMLVPLEAKGSSNGQKFIFQVPLKSLISRIFSNLFQMLPVRFFEGQSLAVSIAPGSIGASDFSAFLHNRMHSKL